MPQANCFKLKYKLISKIHCKNTDIVIYSVNSLIFFLLIFYRAAQRSIRSKSLFKKFQLQYHTSDDLYG